MVIALKIALRENQRKAIATRHNGLWINYLRQYDSEKSFCFDRLFLLTLRPCRCSPQAESGSL